MRGHLLELSRVGSGTRDAASGDRAAVRDASPLAAGRNSGSCFVCEVLSPL